MGLPAVPRIAADHRRSDITDPLHAHLTAEEQAMLTLANDSLTAKSSYLDVPVILTALAEARQELQQCKDDRNRLVSENEDLGVQLLRVKGEWPATDGSPMAIMYAKLQQARQHAIELQRDMNRNMEAVQVIQVHLQQAVAALRKYGQHLPHSLTEPGCLNLGECVCGFEKVLAGGTDG